MKLRTRLIMAFFLLSVVPLAGISLYSYISSQRALRQAVESESWLLASDMGNRMESVRRDLQRRIRQLGNFPFRRLMARGMEDSKAQPESPLVSQLVSEMGEIAPFIDSLEFTPVSPGKPPSSPKTAYSSKRPTPLQATGESPKPGGLVIEVAPGSSTEGPTLQRDGARITMRVHMPEIPVPPSASPAAGAPDQPAADEAAKASREAAREMRRGARALEEAAKLQNSPEFKRQIQEISEKAQELSKKQLELTLGRGFDSPVQVDGELVGTVRAQIRSRDILRSVLRRTDRQEGEIPFAVDSAGKIYVADDKDLSKIEALPLPGVSQQEAVDEKAGKSWVVVTRRDEASDLTFGIARPIGERLGEIRLTAVRNLAVGMGIVGLALIGILPLSNRMTRDLTNLTRGAEQLAQGRLDVRVRVRSKDEFGRLAETFNRMAHDLSENQDQLLEQERMRKELELCRRIQEDLLPRSELRFGVVEAMGVSIPAREVGGDFFNYFGLQDGNVALLVGDVSGKGLPAALLMANLQATLRARLPMETDLAALADRLDREIEASTPPEVYLTLFMGIYDAARGELRYVNAGHNPQFALHPGGRAHCLESTGRPLGLLSGGGYTEGRVKLAAMDSLFLYTDGLVEAENENGEDFGMQRLEALVTGDITGGLSGTLARVEEVVRNFRGNSEAQDDATLVLFRVAEGSGLKSLRADEI